MERHTFASLGLSPEILKAVDKLGFEEASPIQAAAIPVLMAGKDVVGQSQTGSGKTAAFAIPAIEKTDPTLHAVQVLVLCPTRELATQVAGEVHKLAAGKRGIHAVPVYGGSSFERQAQELKRGAQIVLGTPGRVIDHLERGTLKLDRLRFIVLDEADRMLDMGFRDDIKKILDAMPAEKQTAFFSATVSPTIRKLIDRYARDPVTLKIDQKTVDAPDITQWYYEVPPRTKFDALLRIIDFHSYRSGIIFCNTQRTVDDLADDLQAQGIPSDRLHGGIAQAQRTRVMNKFKAGGFDFLVATDVAGRGIDVDDLELVVNFDLPYDPEDYVHRIGRTGRAGRSGRAVSFVYGREIYRMQSIERYTRSVVKRERIPSVEQVEGRRADLIFDDLKERLESGKFDNYQDNIDRLLEQGHTPTDIAGALVTMIREASGREGGAIEEDREPERPARRENVRPQRDDRPNDHQRDDRGPRQERVERAPRDAQRSEAGMTRLFLSLGKTHGVMAKEIVGMLYREVGLPDGCLGRISLFPKHSLVDVPEQFVSQVMDRTRNSRLRGRPFRMDVDRGPGDREG